MSEWKSYWSLPAAAALGYATSVIHIYGLSPYFGPLEEAFGWSRSQVTVGLTIATLINGVAAVPIGMLVDRLGPRVVGLIGVFLATGAFALMGTATGSNANWYFLWGLMALATLPIQATVWTSAVASRFEVSRGMALAITLSGASIAQTLFPPLATRLIEAFGWRTAFMAEAAIWAALVIPMVFFFFRGAKDKQKGEETVAAPTVPLEGMAAKDAFKTLSYAKLFVACLLFTFTIVGLAVHFIPILMGQGLTLRGAADIAAVVGIFSLIGRLATGFLLDRFKASMVGAVAFLLPILGCAILMTGTDGTLLLLIAVAAVGLTLGSEVDVIVYLTTRHFGMKEFGAIYGGFLLALSVGTAFGPLAASAIYDATGGYSSFLLMTVVCMLGSSVALITLPEPAFAAVGHGKPHAPETGFTTGEEEAAEITKD